MTTTATRKVLALAGAATLVLGLAACGDDSDSAGEGGIEVSGQWARTSPMNAEAGAAYMTISSEDGDVLVSAQVSSDIAGTVELHETRPVEGMTEDTAMTDDTAMTEDTAMGGDTGDMEMEMVPVESIEIPAGGEATLEPGGLHIMLLELAAPLEVGSEFEMTLTFENAGDVTVNVPVLDEAP